MTEEEIKQKIDILFNHPNFILNKDGALQLAISIYQQLQSQLTEKDKQIEELKNQLAITEHDREHNDYELAETYKKLSEVEALRNALVYVQENLKGALHYFDGVENDGFVMVLRRFAAENYKGFEVKE